jgi:serine/threonine protein phosphatase PrpC
MVSDDRILDIVHNAGADVETAAKALVAQANQNGGEDNTTVVVVRITE